VRLKLSAFRYPLRAATAETTGHVVEHLAKAPKQATSSSSRFLESCRKFADGSLNRGQLIAQTAKLGFNDVIDAFHIVNRDEIPIRFFVDERQSTGGIRLTDELSRLRERLQFGNLPQEIEARWRSVEAMRLVDEALKKQASREGKDRLIAVHGNRFVLHLVFRSLGDYESASNRLGGVEQQPHEEHNPVCFGEQSERRASLGRFNDCGEESGN